MHNPNGGGYRRNQSVHRDKSRTLYDKIHRDGKLTFKDIINYLNEDGNAEGDHAEQES